jgi:hypothetical protein
VERSRARALIALGVGLLLAIASSVIDWWPGGVVATLLLIGGGIALAVSFRREAGLDSTSHAGLLSLEASLTNLRSKGGRSTIEQQSGQLEAYALRFGGALTDVEVLLAGTPSALALEEARERLMVLVASPMYGSALRAGLIDEEVVRAVVRRLGEAGEGTL